MSAPNPKLKRAPDKNTATALYLAAEARLKAEPVLRRAQSEVELEKFLHELEVYQIVLELQNEELQATRAELEAGIERYTDLYDFAPVGYFTLTVAGNIQLVNLTGAKLMGVERARLVGRQLQSLIAVPDRPAFASFLLQAFAGGSRQSCELRLLDQVECQRFVALEATVSPSGNECRLVMLEITGRKSAAEKHALLASIVESSLDGIISKNLDGIITTWNPGAQKLFGYAPEEIVGTSILRLVPADRVAEEDDILTRISRGENVMHFDTVRRLKCGQLLDVSVTASPIRDAAGQILGVSKTLRDITERKQAERALAEAWRFLQSTIDALTTHICVLDEHSNILATNQAWDDFASANSPDTRASWKGVNYLAACDGATEPERADASEFAAGIRAVVQGRQSHFSMEYPCHSPTSLRWFAAHVNRFAQTDPVRVVIAHENITDRKLAEIRLLATLEEAKRFRSALDEVQACVFMKDLQSRHTYANRAMLELFGCATETLLEAKVATLFPSQTIRRLLDSDGRVFRGEQIVEEIELLDSRGRRRVFLELKAPMYGDPNHQTVCGLLGIATDITERKLLEETLQHSRHLLAESEKMGKLGSWELDMVTQLVTWTESVFAIHEQDPTCPPTLEQAIQFYTPACQPIIQRAVRRAMEQGETFDLELQIITTKGAKRDVHTIGHADPVRHKVFGFFQDITERKRTEQELVESESKFRAIFDVSPVPMALNDEQRRITALNQAFVQTFGYTLADIPTLAEWWLRAYPEPAYRQWVAETWQAELNRINQTGTAFSPMEVKVCCKDGTRKSVLVGAAALGGAAAGTQLVVLYDITERQTQAMELRGKTAMLEALVHSSPDGILVVSPQGKKTIQNRRVSELWQIPQPIADDPDDQTQYAFAREQARDSATFDAATLRLVTNQADAAQDELELKDGRILARQTALVRDTTGTNYGRVWIFRDITKSKTIEAKLREREELLRLFVEHSPAAIAMFDSRMNYLVVSRRWLKDYGLQGQSFAGRNHYEVFPEIPQTWREIHRRCLAGASEKCDQEAFVRSDGTIQYIRWEIQPWQQGDGTIGGIIIFSEDTTELNRADEQLQVQISALTAVANAIVITDRQGKIEWANPAFTKLSGYSAEEIKGGNPRVQNSGQHPPAFYGTMWATILTGNVWRGELVNKRKDGRLYTEEMTITPVWGTDGQIAHFVAVKQDITEHRQMEKRLLQAQKMEAIGQLAGGIAHDFNNMLAAMFGYAHLLQQDTAGNPLAQESVAEILTAANRAKDLVQQILTFSRQREQQPQIIKLDMIIKEVIKFLRASLPAHIKVEKELAVETPAVLADPTQIYQVIMNLATNALHAMEDAPGRLLIRLNPLQPDEKLIQTHPQLRPVLYACLAVADSGHGMDAKTLEHIFEPFFTTKPVGKGTGLGLAVVHGIVAAHNGVVTVESQVGRGTTFTLYFPAQGKAEALTAADASEVPHGRGQKILVLDDETALTSVLQKMLRRLDYEVATSNQAREAVSLVRDNPTQFDLVLTDLTMPEMNGLEVAKQIRAIRADLPIILVSGYSVTVDADRLREAGICERLEKPVSPTVLAEVVARVLIRMPA